ncbi:MAG: helix-turn-helix domain-containing protein, partial [bacterium]|nr:helix-turn-helix domain-containing protein [bacterium]
MVEQGKTTWLSLGEAARRLNVHPTTLRRWASNGDIPVMVTPGGHRRFAPADVERIAQIHHGVQRVPDIKKIFASEAL